MKRLRAWLIERLGGELPDDWDWEPRFIEPDYYTDDGLPVYDLGRRILALQHNRNDVLTVLLDKVLSVTPEPKIKWMDDDGR